MGLQEERQKLAKATTRMMKRVQIPAAKINKIKAQAAAGVFQKSSQWAKARRDIDQAYKDLDRIYQSYSEYAIPKSYKIKVGAERKRIGKIKVAEIQKRVPDIVLDSNFHKGAIKVLTDDTIIIYSTAVSEGKKVTQGLLRRTQQMVITEEKLNIEIVQALGKKGTIQETKNRILRALQEKLVEPYVLKAGSKHYRAGTYAELVARTRTREAQSIATLNVAANVQSDLVQVDSHNTTTPICIPFEGRIFSISGRDPDFPPLTDEPPFHPNCLHNITVIFREVLEARGIEKYIDFAKGKTEKHPTLSGWIPVSKREIA